MKSKKNTQPHSTETPESSYHQPNNPHSELDSNPQQSLQNDPNDPKAHHSQERNSTGNLTSDTQQQSSYTSATSPDDNTAEQLSDTIQPSNTPLIIEASKLRLQSMKHTNNHYCIAQAAVGLSHVNGKTPLPCQDSVKATLLPRPILIACDGAGSSTMSDVGSQALCTQITRFCSSIEPIIKLYLDEEESPSDYHLLVTMIYRQAIGILKDLSEQHRRDIKDFRSTLNFAIIGTHHILWLKVGDGEIIQETILYYDNQPHELIYQSKCLGHQVKGEYANQTQFIDKNLQCSDIQYGLLKRSEVHGLALMSDGASEKLVSNNREYVSGQIHNWLQQLRQGQLKAGDIIKRFYADDFNLRSTGDDRSIVLWATEIMVDPVKSR